MESLAGGTVASGDGLVTSVESGWVFTSGSLVLGEKGTIRLWLSRWRQESALLWGMVVVLAAP